MSTLWSLCEPESGRVIVPELELATTFWRRFRGLQFRPPLSEGGGLLLAPCRSIHTQWMRFSIDVVFFDESGQVLDVRPNTPPWRFITPVNRAVAVLEVAANSTELAPEERVGLIQRSEQALTLPKTLRGWPVLESPLSPPDALRDQS